MRGAEGNYYNPWYILKPLWCRIYSMKHISIFAFSIISQNLDDVCSCNSSLEQRRTFYPANSINICFCSKAFACLEPIHYMNQVKSDLWTIGPLWRNCTENLIKRFFFLSRKCIWKCCLQNGSHFVQASMGQCIYLYIYILIEITCWRCGQYMIPNY